MQVPPEQLALGQATPQPPQLKGSLLRSAHKPPHMTVGKTQPISTWTGKQVSTPWHMPKCWRRSRGRRIRCRSRLDPPLRRPAARGRLPRGQAASQPRRQWQGGEAPGDERRPRQRRARRHQSWRCPRNPPLAPNPGGALCSARASGTSQPNALCPRRVASCPGPRYRRRGRASSDAARSSACNLPPAASPPGRQLNLRGLGSPIRTHVATAACAAALTSIEFESHRSGNGEPGRGPVRRLVVARPDEPPSGSICTKS